jgi:hypothetical protein
MGGLALNGYCGEITRIHNDLDLICWRKDIKTAQNALNKIGYKIRVDYFNDKPKIPYRFETDEENPAISFNIIDERPNNSFAIYFNSNEQIYPKGFLGPVKVFLDDMNFKAVDLKLLDIFNEQTRKNLNQIKKDNPKLYEVLSCKIVNNKNDRKIINKLM